MGQEKKRPRGPSVVGKDRQGLYNFRVLLVTERAGSPSRHARGLYKGKPAALPVSIQKQSDFLSRLQGDVVLFCFSFQALSSIALLRGDLMLFLNCGNK